MHLKGPFPTAKHHQVVLDQVLTKGEARTGLLVYLISLNTLASSFVFVFVFLLVFVFAFVSYSFEHLGVNI